MESTRKKPGSSKSSLHRKKMKQKTPEKYTEYQEKQKMHMREVREKLKNELKKKNPTPEAVEKQRIRREQGRLRQQRYKERKKSLEKEGGREKLVVKFKKTVTRSLAEEQKEKWRQAQQKCRANWTHQKREWKKRKDRAYQQRRREEKLETELKNPGYTSKQTLYNHTSQARKALPNTPRKYASVLGGLLKRASPRKKKALEEAKIGITCRSLFASSLHKSVKSSSTKVKKIVAAKLLKIASRRLISRQLKLNRKTVTRAEFATVRKRKPCTDPHLIRAFFFREDISRPLPQKRFATKLGPGYLLQMTLKSAYNVFSSEYPDKKLSFPVFCRQRPRNVRLLSANHRDFCLCVYCINVRCKLLALNRIAAAAGKEKLKIANENHLVDVLLCPKSDGVRFPRPDCVYSTCRECYNHKQTIKAHYSALPLDQIVTWNHWETVLVNGKSKRLQLAKSLPLSHLLEELATDVCEPTKGTTFVEHLVTANWQYMQFNAVKDKLPTGFVLQVLDFAKNRNIIYQDEIKAAFYGNSAVTLHPIVTYYRKNDIVVRDSLVFVSEDNTHDFHAVQHFCKIADQYIEQKLGKKPEMKIMFSDGCAAQYKSKGPFADLSLVQNMNVNRNFYGSEHGKGQSDGEIGVLNRALDRAIIGRQAVINSAQDLFQWCQQNLTCSDEFSQRHFFFVKEGDVNRERPYTNVKTVPMTRKVHQATNVLGQPYTILVRRLSCFCKVCLMGEDGACPNKEYVNMFKKKTLTLEAGVPAECTESDTEPGDLLDQLLEDLPVNLPVEDLDLANSCQSQTSSYSIAEGDFVMVELEEEKTNRKRRFAAEVLSVQESTVTVKYMHCHNNGLYSWPSEDDVSCEPQAAVVQKLGIPEPVLAKSSNRTLLFSFSEM